MIIAAEILRDEAAIFNKPNIIIGDIKDIAKKTTIEVAAATDKNSTRVIEIFARSRSL
ncbi:MAG: hypothetical protein V1718_04160 [archaeon]